MDGALRREFVLRAGVIEVARFLALRPPFDALAPDELGELVAQTEIEFHPSGAVILSEDGDPVTCLRVLHSGAVELTHAGRLLDLLGPGDTFGHASMLSGLPPGFEAGAVEDTLCYRIPVSVARPLLERARGRDLSVGGAVEESVARLIRVATVCCEPQESVRLVAQRMTDAGASCAIVTVKGGFGIVTDRDVRSRIVAAGLPPSAPVATVMSTPVFSVTPDRLGSEVLFEMLERGIGHAPVVDERGHLVGVIEEADMFARQPRAWFAIRRSIARAHSVEELAALARRLPTTIVALHTSRLRATDVSRVLSALVDAITVRVLDLLAASSLLPSDGVVWAALGSHARRELTPASTARGAVVCEEAPPSAWIRGAAEALSKCGLQEEVIARSPDRWCEMAETDPLALDLLVDRRALWGTPRSPLPLADEAMAERIVKTLAERACAYRPPTGFDGRLVVHADGTRSEHLDIGRAAVSPIVALGRWAGITAGVVEGSTPERLKAGAHAGTLSDEDALTLTDAFEQALELRVAHHTEQLASGSAVHDQIEPQTLSPLMRDQVRDVFRAVAAVQRKLGG